ncbi:hypothetical protein BIW11_05797 [Tropilaelaps mercedesae]|uniref:Uncharacterized protein n=1 Tax=Tropilaelaps mercedesae TaxID=418985 RepID=A0A1V9Y0Y2_9ACAR|nr:hypothetical protein BIW11_05797 [Tropilaelaps mercedesae]
MKIESVESLAPAEPSESDLPSSEAPLVPAVRRLFPLGPRPIPLGPRVPSLVGPAPPPVPSLVANGNNIEHRPQPYRKIVVTSDTRATVDPSVVRLAVSSFVRDKVNALIKEDCIVRLHWNGVDVKSLFLRGIEPLTPQQTSELKGAANFPAGALRGSLSTRPATTPPNVCQPMQVNGAPTVSYRPVTPLVTFRTAGLRAPPSAAAVIRNTAPQLINIPMLPVPNRQANSSAVQNPVRMMMHVPRFIPTLLPKPPPSILRSPIKPDKKAQIVVRVPTGASQSTSDMAVFPSTRTLETPVPLALRAATPPPPAPPPQPPPPYRYSGSSSRAPTLKSNPPPVMVRFNGRVQPAQPGQLIRRTNGQIVRVMPSGNLEEVEVPIVTPKKIDIESSRDKPISLDSDSDDEDAVKPTSQDGGRTREASKEPKDVDATTRREDKGKCRKPIIVQLDEESPAESSDTSTDGSEEFIGVDDASWPTPERRLQRVATKVRLSTDNKDSQFTEERNAAKSPTADSAQSGDTLSTGSSSASDKIDGMDTCKRKKFEYIIGSNGVVERVPIIEDPNLLIPEIDMVVEEKEFTQEMIDSIVEKGVQRALLYAPPPNCRLIFREAEDLDFMDTVIVQDDGEVQLDPELYQLYMEIIYKELVADHRIFKSEQRKRQLAQGVPVPLDGSSSDVEDLPGLSQSALLPLPETSVGMADTSSDAQDRATQSPGLLIGNDTRRKRGRPRKRPNSPSPDAPAAKSKAVPLAPACPPVVTSPPAVTNPQSALLPTSVACPFGAMHPSGAAPSTARVSAPAAVFSPVKAPSPATALPPAGLASPASVRSSTTSPQLPRARKVDPSRPHAHHYVAGNGLVRTVATVEPIKTHQCYVIMDKLIDNQKLAQLTAQGRGTIRLRQQDGTQLPIEKLFAAESKSDLYYDHERGRVDPERKRGQNWNCVLQPVADRRCKVRHPVALRSNRNRIETGKMSTARIASVDPSGCSPAATASDTFAVLSHASTLVDVQPLSIETRKKEIVFDNSDDDYVDIDALDQPSEDDSWEAGTSDEDWDIQDLRVMCHRKRRSKAPRATASNYTPVLVHPSTIATKGTYTLFRNSSDAALSETL